MTASWPDRAAILFSGGGSPGMNAFLRHLVRLGLNRHGALVLGAKDGFAGLVRTARRLESGETTLATLKSRIDTHDGLLGFGDSSSDLVRLDHASVSGLLGRGGIILGASRCRDFHDPAVRRQVIDLLDSLKVQAVIVCGGDGSLAGANCLANESDLRVVGIPATIENDLPMTEMALGVDTAVNTLTWAVGHFADRVISQHRITVLEVLGRHSGELARMAALASGVEIVVSPERGMLTADMIQRIAERLERRLLRGRRHAIVLVTEGVELDPALDQQADAKATPRLVRELQVYFSRAGSLFPDLEARACLLGELQRGGPPSVADRILAARFAEAAWEAIISPGEPSGVLGLQNGSVLLQDFEGPVDPERIEFGQRFHQLQKDVSTV